MNVGIDEAGRGPVLGPLVVAAVWLTPEQENILKAAGVTDSKKLTPAKREELFTLITTTASFVSTRIIIPQEIDDKINAGINLNQIELQAFSALLNKHPSTHAYIDCPSANKHAVAKQLKETYDGTLIVEHKADSTFTVVGAASIIAKVIRDRNIQELQASIPYPIGSGYPADPATKKFLAQHHNEYPQLFRKSWQTYKDCIARSRQQTLGVEEYY